MIYVKNFFIPSDSGKTQKESLEKQPDAVSEVGKTNFKKSENQTSGSLKNQPLEVGKTNPNKNKWNNTDMNQTERKDISSDLIVSLTDVPIKKIRSTVTDSNGAQKDNMSAENLTKEIQKRIDYESLKQRYPFQEEMINGICDLMQEIEVSQSENIVISSSRLPMQLVRERFRKLRYDHVQYVIDCMLANTSKVRNIRKYMLAALFNAPATIDGYYQAEVNHDMPELARR